MWQSPDDILYDAPGPPFRYVFDGKPPELKSHELSKRSEKRSEAEKDLAAAQEKGTWLVIKCYIPHPDEVVQGFRSRFPLHTLRQ